MIRFVPATVEHALYVGNRLRAADAAELMLFGVDAEAAAVESVKHSFIAHTLLIDEIPAAVFGLGMPSLLAQKGDPWLLTTPAIEHVQVAFARHSRQWVARMLSITPRLENFVDARYLRCIQWLQWLGFTVDEPCAGLRRFWMEV